MSTPNKPTIIEQPEQVESLIAGAPPSVTNGATWPAQIESLCQQEQQCEWNPPVVTGRGKRGRSPLHNTREWLRKCHEMTKAIERSQQLHASWQPCAEPSWTGKLNNNKPIDAYCMTEGVFKMLKQMAMLDVEESLCLRYAKYLGVPVHVFQTDEECVSFAIARNVTDGLNVMIWSIEDSDLKLPFELGKTKITIAKPVDEHQRFDCYPMRIENGKLICCIQNDRSGWWEDWNLEHTISGIKSGFYKVEKTGETIENV